MANLNIKMSHALIRYYTRSRAVATTGLSIKLLATVDITLANVGCWTEILKMPKRKTSFNPDWAKEHGLVTKSRKDEFHHFSFIFFVHCVK